MGVDVTRQRRQGKWFETVWTRQLNAAGADARKLVEEGIHDRGDVESRLPDGMRIVWECKHAERLPAAPHELLRRAQDKAQEPAAIVWKRSTAKPGNARRSSDGTVVILDAQTFLTLVARLEGQDR